MKSPGTGWSITSATDASSERAVGGGRERPTPQHDNFCPMIEIVPMKSSCSLILECGVTFVGTTIRLISFDWLRMSGILAWLGVSR